jgi:hypothetical protein
MDDLPFRFQASQFAGFANQGFVNVDISSAHGGPSIHQVYKILCIRLFFGLAQKAWNSPVPLWGNCDRAVGRLRHTGVNVGRGVAEVSPACQYEQGMKFTPTAAASSRVAISATGRLTDLQDDHK